MKSTKFILIHKTIFCLFILFFLSGMCGLVYQIIWTRLLALLFGHTTFAISTVITAFMGGLALGSFWFGRWADQDNRGKRFFAHFGQSSLLLAYGIMEALIGLYALFTPWLFKGVELIYLQFPTLSFYPLNILRFLLCSLVLIIPTFLMGGTLPLLSKFLIRTFTDIGSKLGQLYFINTIGATAGAFVAGFFLINTIGISNTMQLAAFINITIGIIVCIMNRGQALISPTTAASTDTVASISEIPGDAAPSNNIGSDNAAKLLFVLFAFTGFASMIYELCWTRALALALGSSSYAFSTMLTTFLLGIAIGSAIFSRLASKKIYTTASFGWLQGLIALFCLLAVPLLGTIPLYFVHLFPLAKNSYTLIIMTNFLLSALVMIMPTTLMGFAFPLVGSLYTQNLGKLGKSVGDIYAVNTFGCIIGAFLTGFVLIPFLGVQNSLKVAVMINGISGLLVLLNYYHKPLLGFVSISSMTVGIMILYLMPSWNIGVMSSGSAVYAENFTNAGMDVASAKKNTVFYKDGISCTVSVHQEKWIFLKINGKVDASTGFDMPTQILVAYIPIFYHENPEDVFVIGLGSGMTAKAVLDFPQVKSVTCAELEPAVIEANSYFYKYNDEVVHNPKFKIRIDDGRNALLASRNKYDLIISEPSNPWIAGVSNLFTEDFYRISKNRLKPGGIFCQWFHLYRMQPSDVKMVMRTFFSVFPHGTVWQANGVDLMLLGSEEELFFNYNGLKQSFLNNKKFQETIKTLGIKAPEVFFAHYVTESAELKPLFKTAQVNTDDLPLLEFSAPKSLYLDTTLYNLSGIYAYKTEQVPKTRGGYDGLQLSADYFIAVVNQVNVSAFAEKTLRDALAAYPKNPDLRVIKVKNLLFARKYIQAEQELKSIVSDNPSHFLSHYLLARLYNDQGMLKKAENMYDKAAIHNNDHEAMNKERITNLIQQEKYAKALSIVKELKNKSPTNVSYDYLYGLVNMKMNNFSEALEILENSLKKNPDHYDIAKCLFNIYQKQGNFMKMAEIGISLHTQKQDDFDVTLGLGQSLPAVGQNRKAFDILTKALDHDPYNRQIIDQLAQLEAQSLVP